MSPTSFKWRCPRRMFVHVRYLYNALLPNIIFLNTNHGIWNELIYIIVSERCNVVPQCGLVTGLFHIWMKTFYCCIYTKKADQRLPCQSDWPPTDNHWCNFSQWQAASECISEQSGRLAAHSLANCSSSYKQHVVLCTITGSSHHRFWKPRRSRL